MIHIAVVGYGNIGRAALEAIEQAPDMCAAGIVRRDAQPVQGYRVVQRVEELGQVDVALLCVPSRLVQETASAYLSKGIHTVDSFDIHPQIGGLRAQLDGAAKQGNACCVLAAGWDPGSDSVIRALLMACAPQGMTYTNFGPGLSMGHSVVAKSKEGVKDALSITIPKGEGLHRRMVYVELEQDVRLEEAEAAIKSDPYFSSDETYVIEAEDIEALRNAAHGVHLTRSGVSGATHNQQFDFTMRIDNPALTSQIMVACARAATRQKPGCYTMIELPVVDLLPGEREQWIGKLV